MSPEIYSYLLPLLFEQGALDVYLTPIIMKKGRQANILNVLTSDKIVEKLKATIFRETTTLGIREYRVKRDCLEREIISVETELGVIRVKAAFLDGELLKGAPEYEDCKAAALLHNRPIREIYELVNKTFLNEYKGLS